MQIYFKKEIGKEGEDIAVKYLKAKSSKNYTLNKYIIKFLHKYTKRKNRREFLWMKTKKML